MNNQKNPSLSETPKSGNSGNSVSTDNEIGGNSDGNNEVTVEKLVTAKDEKNLSLSETPKSGNSGNSVSIGNDIVGNSEVTVVTVAKVKKENLEHIKNIIKSYEETINDKRPLEGRDKQPFINWYFKQNGNSISAGELWGIVEKEKAFTPETHPTPTHPALLEQSTTTVEVCGEISEVILECL